ncbi:hypothetical protein BGM26_08145 [Bacillus sp. FJAT-29790]|uniref:hypothetical protein n=1 Tax=Bacillus sp. FJAT-29790 TaxID=1895002 RepID=UPI001C222278|nr:hypothetical protein [Bacillus sp. FJAT-29790]MBU8878955.1 hypothetical protein [Bacillus sp. FJAT-29790]
MRFLFRRSRYRVLDSDLEIVTSVLCSGYFILADLFFWSLLLTFLTIPLHQSLIFAIFIFTSSYVFGASLYLLLKKWLGEKPD